MKVFNTLTKKLQTFKPVNAPHVTLYTCGPTVYNYAHIGNFRTYLFEDLLRRWLKYNGYKVNQVMNLTDVDDKTIRDSQKEGTSLFEFTERYSAAFFEDIDALNIERAEAYPKATDHVEEMVIMIMHLLEKKIAYKTDDGIYFSISKFKKYGQLAHIDPEQMKAGASGRVKADEYEKDNVADFALWKFWDEKDGEVAWDVPFGKGRPGWHIECSAMSAKCLTNAFEKHGDHSHFHADKFETIDIHTGGVDNIFPHHQDEIAQTEALVKKKFVNYWMHSEHLLVNNQKMSKSLGNFYTLRDLLKKGYNPIAIRYLLLSTHYRQKLNFTLESIDAATVAVQRINDFVLRLNEATAEGETKAITKAVEKARKQFEKSLNNDLEISPALAAIFDLMTTCNKKQPTKKDAALIKEFMQKIDSVLGILTEQEKLPANLTKMIADREQARKDKNWKLADHLRDELKKHGIQTEDTPNGQRWKRILSN